MQRKTWFILMGTVIVASCSQAAPPGQVPLSAVASQTEATAAPPTVESQDTLEVNRLPTQTRTPPPTPGGEADADVLFVRAIQSADGSWTFDVTVIHPDKGWDDYADGWDVILPDGTVLKPDPGSPFTRLLLHPHENEQPFTRNQPNIVIPEGITQVRVRAHDIVSGFGGQEIVVDLTLENGNGFEVIRN